jgi:hypothetical protein
MQIMNHIALIAPPDDEDAEEAAAADAAPTAVAEVQDAAGDD